MYSFVIRPRLEARKSERGEEGEEEEKEGETSVATRGKLTVGRGPCAPRVISNVPGCRDSTLMERVALTPAFARQARRSSGVAQACFFFFPPPPTD